MIPKTVLLVELLINFVLDSQILAVINNRTISRSEIFQLVLPVAMECSPRETLQVKGRLKKSFKRDSSFNK